MSKLLNYFFEQGFHLIRIIPRGKTPRDKAWQLPENKLSLSDVHYWLSVDPDLLKNKHQGFAGNIAVVCGKNSEKDGLGLIAFDFDSRPELTPENIEKFRAYKTLVMFSPKGYRLFFRTDNPERAKKLITGRSFDVARWTGGYSLLPPSKVLQKDGSIKSYWFLDDSHLPAQIRVI